MESVKLGMEIEKRFSNIEQYIQNLHEQLEYIKSKLVDEEEENKR